MIKVISFDIGNTIIEKKRRSTIESLEIILKKDKKDFIKEYKRIFQVSTDELEKCVKNFLQCINKEEKYNEIMQLFLDEENEKTEIDIEKVQTINNLKELGYKIIALSNSCKYRNIKQKEYLKESNLFDDIIYSYEVKFPKPDYRIYKFVEEKYDVNPSEILHIGDSVISDYQAPIEFGWNAILYDPKNIISDKNINKITHFSEILEKVKGK